MSDQAKTKPLTIDPTALPSAHAVAYLNSLLRTIPDFPKPGIMFKDITPLLGDPRGLNMVLDLMAAPFIGAEIQHTVAMEARGFIFGGALAARLNHSFVPIRKPGKLPADVDEVSYSLEYGEGRLQMHKGSISPGDKVLIVDDLLATGGTAAASVELVHAQGGVVAAFIFVVELDFLKGADKLRELTNKDVPVFSLIHIDD
jgi:adenine phosphoribosyltransferase